MNKYHPNTYRSHAERAYLLLARKPVLLFSLILSTIFLFAWYRSTADLRFHHVRSIDKRRDFDGTWVYQRDRNNLLLDDSQCGVAFPRLFEEVDRAVTSRRGNHVSVVELDAIQPKNGYVRAMIYDQEVWFGNEYEKTKS